ncbi:hypothetical protein Dvina_28265 [Dactylosporangium vinaceum]|uniref:DUF5709 domain-containing protein n=1 Tax=Dactylosporangium vinaceum TaxID=53362 RepID=A0ABV5MMQ4_9ACTN|nr:hypothetical protein [Dactylosporangium vinaceum]UAB92268.1 hypothetical protein Dvina_28265 [Dactylosporangium vinaceum]
MSDVDYGQYEAGQESGELDQLHQAEGSEADHDSRFGVYEQDHHAAESTDFSQGQHVEYDAPGAVHFESDDYTNYSHDASVDDRVFTAEGGESSHQAEFSELDALKARFDNAFVSGTEFSGSDAELTAAS